MSIRSLTSVEMETVAGGHHHHHHHHHHSDHPNNSNNSILGGIAGLAVGLHNIEADIMNGASANVVMSAVHDLSNEMSYGAKLTKNMSSSQASSFYNNQLDAIHSAGSNVLAFPAINNSFG